MSGSFDRLGTALASRYRLERELGEGGMAKVYLAHDLKYDREVAVKVVRPELAAEVSIDRFLREIQVAARLHHPHILPLYDSDQADGLAYYVMPYIKGETLRQRLARERQLPVDEALQIAREVADALTYAHRQGIVHRDIKPANILLDAGHALVADFGIARAIGEAQTLTSHGRVIGTPSYMSPEQVEGSEHVDGRSDIYSLGCVVFEMLVGQPPFKGSTLTAVIANRLSTPVPSTRQFRELVPEAVDAAIRKAVEPPGGHEKDGRLALRRTGRPCFERRSVSGYDSLTTFSAAGPFWPCTMSNSTFSPSARLLKPWAWIAE